MSCLHYSGRRSLFLIRVNGHLVQCRPLEHSIEALYSGHARAKPFVFLVGACVSARQRDLCRVCHQSRRVGALQDIAIPGDQVDVNVHPTKHEVILLHQDAIVEAITSALEQLQQGPVRCAPFFSLRSTQAWSSDQEHINEWPGPPGARAPRAWSGEDLRTPRPPGSGSHQRGAALP